MVLWFEDLSRTHDQSWRNLEGGVEDRSAPARHPTLATVGAEGGAEARTVVLRSAIRSMGRLTVYTDTASSKLAELRQAAWSTLHVWDPGARLQLRLRAEADIVLGPDVAEVWTRLPPPSRQDYGGRPKPGMPIESPEVHRRRADASRFGILRFNLLEMETLYLGKEAHYRALFCRRDDWIGTWLAP